MHQDLYDSICRLLKLQSDQLQQFSAESKWLLDLLQTYYLTQGAIKDKTPDFEQKPNTEWTFSTLLNSKFNFEACKTVQDIINNSGNEPEIISIHGPSGVGKSHILHAAAIQLSKKNPHMKIGIINGEPYAQAYKFSILSGTAQTLTQSALSYDFLIIDDLQHIANASADQTHINFLISTYLKSNRKVLVSFSPDIFYQTSMRLDLFSTLADGVLCRIRKPETNELMTLATFLAKRDQVPVSQNIISTLFNYPISDIRQLQLILKNIVFMSKMRNTKITKSLVIDVLTIAYGKPQ